MQHLRDKQSTTWYFIKPELRQLKRQRIKRDPSNRIALVSMQSIAKGSQREHAHALFLRYKTPMRNKNANKKDPTGWIMEDQGEEALKTDIEITLIDNHKA